MELNMWAVCIVYEGADTAIKAMFESPIEAEEYRRQLRKDMDRVGNPRISVEVRSMTLEKYTLEDLEIPWKINAAK